MTKVKCDMCDCKYNQRGICASEEIDLSEIFIRSVELKEYGYNAPVACSKFVEE